MRGRASLAVALLACAALGCGGPAPPPEQPLPFSHELHAGQLEMDCLFCHGSAEHASWASLPSGRTCMLCHWSAGADSEAVQELVRRASEDEPIAWVQVFEVPDHVRFTHARHVGVGVECSQCHGDVAAMEVVRADRELTMGFCVDCHRQRGATLDCVACHH